VRRERERRKVKKGEEFLQKLADRWPARREQQLQAFIILFICRTL
jgi:hypothetical protein